MDEKKIVRIFSDNDGPDTGRSLKVMIGDTEIPLIGEIEFCEGGKVSSDTFLTAKLTVAVKFGR